MAANDDRPDGLSDEDWLEASHALDALTPEPVPQPLPPPERVPAEDVAARSAARVAAFRREVDAQLAWLDMRRRQRERESRFFYACVAVVWLSVLLYLMFMR